MDLVPYSDSDEWLTRALETNPEVMRHLGGPTLHEDIPLVHRRRLGDPWWLTIVPEPEAPAVGTIGVWPKELDGEPILEVGWMIVPEQQGRGLATRALGLLLDRIHSVPGWDTVHAFPAVTNSGSNSLCRKLGFVLLGVRDFDYAGRTLECNHWRLSIDETDRQST